MKTHEFVCEEHKEYGGLGWRLADMPDFDPTQGMGVAHDIMEHFPGGDESPADELLAFGAALWLRGENGLYRSGDWAYNSHYELVETILRHAIEEGIPLPAPPNTYRLYSQWAEKQIAECLEQAGETIQTGGLFDEEETKREYLALLPLCRGWLRLGYRRAERRYHNCIGSYSLAHHVFKGIQDAANEALEMAGEGEGYTLRVCFHGNRCNYLVRLMQDGREVERWGSI